MAASCNTSYDSHNAPSSESHLKPRAHQQVKSKPEALAWLWVPGLAPRAFKKDASNLSKAQLVSVACYGRHGFHVCEGGSFIAFPVSKWTSFSCKIVESRHDIEHMETP